MPGWQRCSSSVALLGVLSGVMFAYAGDLPLISDLDDYAPSAITRVYASTARRSASSRSSAGSSLPTTTSPRTCGNAIISAEDKDFNNHFGLSVSAMLIRLSSDIVRRRIVAGASTLTMQLARDLFAEEIGFTLGDKSPERKIKEILVAIQIEKRYTKREILTFYCNQTHFGHGTNGVEAAARLYFGKRAKDVTLEEAAMIAGIIQTPARQSPYVNRAAAKFKRDYTLQQMAENGYITQEQADASKKKPIVTRGQPQPRAIGGALLHRGSPQVSRAEIRRENAIRKRPVGADGHRHPAAAGGESRGRPRPPHRRQAPRLPPRQAEHRRAGPQHRHLPSRAMDVSRSREDDIVPAVVVNVSPTSARVRVGQQIAELRGDGDCLDDAARLPRCSRLAT